MAVVKYKLETVDDIYDYNMRYREELAWKKLYDKTQVFNVRTSDAVKTRGSHSVDVGEIAAMLTSGLTDDPVKIAKSRLLGELHDIGHIPFGHAGESIADSIIKDRYESFTEEEKRAIATIRESLFGTSYASKNKKPCFEHNENSVLQYYIISSKLGYEVDPEIVEGILSHSTSRYPELPVSLVQQAVRLADKVAYINYDVEDLRISFEGKEEWEALKEIYSGPILDENDNAITIGYNGKSYATVLEFLEDLDVSERLNIFIEEAVKMAKEDKLQNDPLYSNHETVLTGGNDIVVKLSSIKKNPEYYDSKEKKWTPKGIEEKKRLKQLLMKKSPILYLSYEMKERSDEFIRSGVGLSIESQKERSEKAQSPVGNDDLKNQYIYNKLVNFIEKRDKIELDKLPTRLQEVLNNFFKAYDEFKQTQEEVISNLPGNDMHVQYPEIYTILNFVGSHSNEELLSLSYELGIDKLFEQEVLSQIKIIIENEQFFDKSTQRFTKEGLEKRDEIVEQYGAFIKFRYGIDEYDFTPTTSENVLSEAAKYGYREEGYDSKIQQIEKSKEEIINEIHETDKTIETDLINRAQAYANSKKTGVSHGRK